MPVADVVGVVAGVLSSERQAEVLVVAVLFALVVVARTGLRDRLNAAPCALVVEEVRCGRAGVVLVVPDLLEILFGELGGRPA